MQDELIIRGVWTRISIFLIFASWLKGVFFTPPITVALILSLLRGPPQSSSDFAPILSFLRDCSDLELCWTKDSGGMVWEGVYKVAFNGEGHPGKKLDHLGKNLNPSGKKTRPLGEKFDPTGKKFDPLQFFEKL